MAGICCSAVWSRNCFCDFILVYISRFRFLIRFRLHVKFCSFVITNVTLSLNLMTVPLIILFTYQRKVRDWIYLFCSSGYVNNLDEWVSQIIIRKCERLIISNFKTEKSYFHLVPKTECRFYFFARNTLNNRTWNVLETWMGCRNNKRPWDFWCSRGSSSF